MDSVDRMIAAWHDSRPGLEVSQLEVVGRLLLCARHLEQALVGALKPLGLSFGDFDVLNTVRRVSAPVNPRELARSSLVTSGAMTARLDRLADAGLIERTADPADRRGVLVSLSSDGERVADEALRVVLCADEEFLAPLDPAQREAVAGLLRSLLRPHERED
ncbi:MarR family winged helix-turn-helix transcriptional regulator [Prauserella cavernicola]|uniref:MarR family transcriptional regulator n=1 Tax=Prauserella cavernicola TaxID=2800127 RepID=A0A934QQE3_9PSEU|nr:MarR family transcriptional regulator [Prauserella cavernicola]MBK1783509.1 MarR family transcriptional regulator [Prauserella cavernicola]